MSQAYFEARTPRQLCKLLGLPATEAAKVEMRRDLVIAIKNIMEANGWTHSEAAEIAGISRTAITGIVNGNIARVSTDRLIDTAQSLGLTVKLKVA